MPARSTIRLLLSILLWITVTASASFAQNAGDAPPNAAAGNEPDLRSDDEPPLTDEKKQQTVTVAVYLAFGVALLGMLLIVLVLVWGVRVRRLVRTRVPSQSLPDPLWYLRNRKQGTVQDPPRESRHDLREE